VGTAIRSRRSHRRQGKYFSNIGGKYAKVEQKNKAIKSHKLS
jgi:hypothetical protein